ncbi:hypothetical protein WB91_08770 [bacteria symbiont BFo1 of Frankliniella occidentalis]|nr:hypothetical protein WB91_08770 [bacteria symbiont BFo1 of Frankliniella occidentalis]
MKYSFDLEEKQFRRIMLDIAEITPRKLRKDIFSDMQLSAEMLSSGYFKTDYTWLIDYLYRLRDGRSFRGASEHKLRLMQEILNWVEAANLHRTGKPYAAKTAQMRYKIFIEEKKESETADLIYERNRAFQKKHPLLYKLRENYLVLIVSLPLVLLLGPWMDLEPFQRLKLILVYSPIVIFPWALSRLSRGC